ncbi:WD40 repeat domain-containing protein [Gemmata sp. SH-PL17]|uniref:WD40 repeat domain-containing protein n=1 Tax=Gemmata sp. SH-PL17 TaxID=1630693 RepID=UPI002101AE47|nr:WD40 repeat domain-containing protein [Gemmata sp. SH-PL17]
MPVAAATPSGTRFAFTTARAGAGAAGTNGDRLEFSNGAAVECEGIADLRFAPDGRLWAADGHRIRVWTAPQWTEECPLENAPVDRSGGVVFRAVAPGNTVSVAGRRDGRVYVLRASGPVHSVPPPFNSAVTALRLSADEKRVLVGGERGELCLLEASGRLVTLLRGAHRDEVTTVMFGPGGCLVTGSADRTIKLWVAGLKPVLTLWFGGAVQQARLSSDGQLLTVLVRGERGVRRWRLDHLTAALADLGLPPGWP